MFKLRGNFGYGFSSFFNLVKLVNGVDTVFLRVISSVLKIETINGR